MARWAAAVSGAMALSAGSGATVEAQEASDDPWIVEFDQPVDAVVAEHGFVGDVPSGSSVVAVCAAFTPVADLSDLADWSYEEARVEPIEVTVPQKPRVVLASPRCVLGGTHVYVFGAGHNDRVTATARGSQREAQQTEVLPPGRYAVAIQAWDDHLAGWRREGNRWMPIPRPTQDGEAIRVLGYAEDDVVFRSSTTVDLADEVIWLAQGHVDLIATPDLIADPDGPTIDPGVAITVEPGDPAIAVPHDGDSSSAADVDPPVVEAPDVGGVAVDGVVVDVGPDTVESPVAVTAPESDDEVALAAADPATSTSAAAPTSTPGGVTTATEPAVDDGSGNDEGVDPVPASGTSSTVQAVTTSQLDEVPARDDDLLSPSTDLAQGVPGVRSGIGFDRSNQPPVPSTITYPEAIAIGLASGLGLVGAACGSAWLLGWRRH